MMAGKMWRRAIVRRRHILEAFLGFFPDGLPSIVLSKIDDCDEVSLSAIQLMLRSPTFRLIILLYFSLLNIGFVVLLLRKR